MTRPRRPPRPHDWRPTLKRRGSPSSRRCSACGSAGIEARARLPAGRSIAPTWWRAPSGSRCARRRRRRSAATSSIAAGRVLATSVDADTIYAVPDAKSATPPTRSQKLCDALGDCTRKERQALADKLGQQRAFAYVRRQVSPEQARARRRAEPRRHRLHQGEPALLSEQGAGGAPARLRRRRQQRARAASSRPTTRRFAARPARSSSTPTRAAMRSAASSGRRRPARRIELTIDEYLQHIAERELHAGVAREPRRRRHRHHHESAHRRDSGDGERADVQPERLSRLRRRPSGATAPCRISTSRARRSRS